MAKLKLKDALSKADGLLKKGRAQDAGAIYQTILRAQPGNAQAARGMKAVQARNTVADPPKAVLDEVMVLLRGSDFKQAAVRAKTLLKTYPSSPNLWNMRALACNASHRFDDAVAACEMVVSLSPSSPEAHLNLGNALRKVERYEAAISALQRALELKPSYPFAFNSLGNVQASQSMSAKAIESYSKAIELDPKYAEAHHNLGDAQVTAHLLDAAAESYRKTIEINPDYGKVYRGLSAITTFKLDDPVVTKMHALLDKLQAQGETDHSMHLCFALAKVYRDNKDFETSFLYLNKANTLLATSLRYDPSADHTMFRSVKSTARRIASAAFDASESPAPVTPIFILGMPRSGTTLTEQILACHSDVTAAGELGFVREFGQALTLGSEPPTEKNLQRFRGRYFEAISKLSEGRAYVTDKMPHNFRYIGLIRKALPEAIIINLKRDPAAVCWSNFWQFFPRLPLGYATGIETTVDYFGKYQDLMQFWQEQLPDEYYVLDYDRLVVDQEDETRALLERCGLPWQDACLSPHKKKRDVHTASKYQVTKPVYKGSSAAWKAFEPYLDGAFDVFKAERG